MGKFSAADNALAQEFFQQAIDLDPNFADAHAMLALLLVREFWLGRASNPATRVRELTERVAPARSQRLVMIAPHPAIGGDTHEHDSSRPQHPAHLAQRQLVGGRFREVTEHVEAGEEVERVIDEGQVDD